MISDFCFNENDFAAVNSDLNSISICMFFILHFGFWISINFGLIYTNLKISNTLIQSNVCLRSFFYSFKNLYRVNF